MKPKGISNESTLNYLKQCREIFFSEKLNESNTIFAFGNESTDVDSIASSILAAQALNLKFNGQINAIPVLNSRRPETLNMRGEVLCCLGTGIDKLLINLKHMEARVRDWKSVKVILLDHNELSLLWPEWLVKKIHVAGIIDHHVDSRQHQDCELGRVIEDCGSNTSLVIRELYQKANIQLNDNVALFPIIFDTKHFGFRAVPVDFTSALYLLDSANCATGLEAAKSRVIEETAWVQEMLKAAEVDESQLELTDLLYKDYKKFEIMGNYHLGMSTIRSDLHKHLQKFDSFESLINSVLLPFYEVEELKGLVLLFSYDKIIESITVPMQELLFILPGVDINNLLEYLRTSGMIFESRTHSLDLHLCNLPTRAFWIEQTNRIFNRKRIQPLLQNYLEDLKNFSL